MIRAAGYPYDSSRGKAAFQGLQRTVTAKGKPNKNIFVAQSHSSRNKRRDHFPSL
jgi:hypothetical protein